MSPPITVDIPHQLGTAEARRRIDQGFDSLAQQIGGGLLARVTRSWDGDRMTFAFAALGQSISGRLQVLPYAVRMELQLPGYLAALASSIQGRLRTQGQLLLGKR